MNNEDKNLIAFKEWIENDTLQPKEVSLYRAMAEDKRVMFSMERAWLRACEYKEKEIDVLKNHDIPGYQEGIDYLQAEIEKLKGYLANWENDDS